MPMRFELGPGEHRCTIHLSGVVTREVLEAGVIAQVAAGAWTRQTLLDGTHVTDMTALWRDMQQLVQFVRSTTQGLPPRGRTVILAPNDIVYGSARMYQVALEGVVPMALEVCRTMEEAEAWFASGRSG
ncbi:MAG: hypothetical protein QM736_19300 [Vicinamibacterales bacterium]